MLFLENAPLFERDRLGVKRVAGTNRFYFLVRWQTNAFLVSRTKDLRSYASPRLPGYEVLSGYEDHRWDADTFQIHHTLRTERVTNRVTHSTGFAEGLAKRAAALFIHLAEPGSFTWSPSNTFTAVDRHGLPELVEGEISRIRKGRVAEVRYRRPSRPDMEHFVEYSYEDTSPGAFIPARVTRGMVVNGKTGTNGWFIQVFDFEPSDTLLPKEAFDPNHVMTTSNLAPPILVGWTNHEGYYLVDGGIEQVGRRLTFFQRHSRVAFLTAVILLTAVIGSFMMHINTTNHTKTQYEKNES
jgi:hypothetical protein